MQKGYTLLELLLVLAVATAIVLLSTRFFGVVTASGRISKTLSDIKTIREAANEWAMGKPDYTGISMVALNNAGLLPPSIGDGVGKTAWQGNYRIVPASNPTQLLIGLNRFGFSTSSMPTADCNALASALQNEALSISPTNCGKAAVIDFTATFG